MVDRVTDPAKIVTDSVLLSALAKQGIDKEFVEFSQDYASRSLGKEHSPYAKFYQDLKSNKRFMVVSGLPMVDGDDNKIEVGWQVAGINYFSEKNNLFRARVQGTDVELIIRNDQPDGRKANGRLAYRPQLFLNGVEQTTGQPILLPVDPVNPNYLENTLEWDYGICKRRLRIIEGSILGSWVFPSNPNAEVRIKYNQIGDYRLKLGRYATDPDTEVIPTSTFVTDEFGQPRQYPFTVSDSATYNPDANPETTSVDGYVGRVADNSTWAAIRSGAGTAAGDTDALSWVGAYFRFSGAAYPDLFQAIYRSILLFDSSGLPDGATISAAVLSVRGVNKGDPRSLLPTTVVSSSNPASNTALVSADYGTLGVTKFSNELAFNDFITTGYNDYTLNATGRDAISLVGISKFGIQTGYDIDNSIPGNWAAAAEEYLDFYYSEQGAGYKPKLVVTYTAGVTVTPGTASLATTRYTPVITISDNQTVTPGVASLTTTRYTPVITISDNITVTPGTGTLTTTRYAPVVSLSDNIIVTPGTLALVLTAFTPTISIPITLTPGTLALILTANAPEIFLGTYKIQVDWNNDGDFNDAHEDITPNVKSVRYSRGKSGELGKAEVGQLSITLKNDTGLYSPSNSASAIYTNLKPKRPIRIRAYQSGTIYNLFYGFIEEIIPHPHLTEQDCIITAVDGLDFLSRHDLATALYKDTLTGTLHTYILDDASWSASMRTLDAGQDTVPYWYGGDVKARSAQEEIDDSEQGFSYIDGAGFFRFEDRHHRSTATHQTSQATFSDTMSNISYSLNPKNIYNVIKVTVTPWELKTIVELWRLEETPSIPVGESLTWWGEASVSDIPVFVDAWTTPVSTTDYTANSQSDGLGTDLTASIALVATKLARTIKLVLTNNATVLAYITLLKARGTYYDDQTKVTRKATDATSQTAYQKRTLELDGKYMTNADKAQDYTNYAIGKYKDPRAELSMTIQNQDDATLTQILAREISDRITVVNTKLGLNAGYFIDYLEHDISLSGKSHTVTYRLADTANEDFWCLDYSAFPTAGGVGTQTKLGY